MKRIVVLVVSMWMLQSAHAVVSLPFTDHFDYSEGRLIDVSSGAWVSGNNGTEISVATAAALTSPSGFAAASGKGVSVITSGTQRRAALAFTSVGNTDGNAVYISFLVNAVSVSTTKSIAYLDNTVSSAGSPKLNIYAGGGVIGIGKNSGSTSPGFTTAAGSGAHLVVVRYSFQSGSDPVDLWVDPSSASYAAAVAPASLGSVSSGSDATALSVFQINGQTSGSTCYIDELRVGTSWADVTPTNGVTPPPPPSTNAVTITSIQILTGSNDGDVELRGFGGTPGSNYEVETSSDITIPVTNWLPTGIHQFDADGTFVCTNGVTPSEQQRYFVIHTGGTNSIPPTPPTILTQPQDTTNSAGTVATFNVGVSGSPQFYYQWFLNSVTPLSLKTNSTLTLNNVQTGDSGGYSVLVSNSVGSVTSVVAQLLVTNVFSAPSIITQPQSHSVTVSNNTSFSLVVIGTQPLFYQWYFDTNTLISDATNSTLSLNDVQFSDAGDYSVTVSNSVGVTNSNFATLTVNTNVVVSFGQVGYAGYNYNLTGGSGGPTVDVHSLADMAAYYGTDDTPLPNSNPVVFLIHGTVTLRTNGDTYFGNNKTFLGVGTNAAFIGDIGLYGCQNIIIRNLDLSNQPLYGEDDAVSCKNSPTHIWVDHCTIHDTGDGMIDLTRGGDFLTVSYCKFYYSAPTGHEDVDLIGGDDGDASTDTGKLHVSFHHNWWSSLCRERMISCRFGRAHVFNNYYNIGASDNYCNRTRIDAEMLVEGNWFENVKNPWELLTTSGSTGKVLAQNNNVGYLDTSYNVQWLNGWYSGQSLVPGNDTLTPSSWNPASITDPDPSNVPPYAYTLDNASDVPNIVTNNCGNGKGPFAP